MSKQEKIVKANIEEVFSESFMQYAKKVIMDRSLPDITGCKPVHRRILWGMEDLRLAPNKPTVKSAKLVGNVIGNYHPHGDVSVYDAAVRLASKIDMRYPLIEGQGNFGNISGDGAAAMRYTEIKPSKYAPLMVDGYKKNAVDMKEAFGEDGTLEPVILPGLFPNLFVNPNDGIAVGLASNFLPHNLNEVCDGIIASIKNPDIDTAGLMEFIKGPDYPLGGTVINQKDLYYAYENGRSSNTIKVRGDYEINGRTITFTSIPYGVTTSRIEEQMGKYFEEFKNLFDDYQNETAGELIKLIFEVSKDVDVESAVEWIFKRTDLQKGSSVIMNIVHGEGFLEEVPLRTLIRMYIELQIEVINRTTQFDIDKAEARQHILEGLVVTLADIDEVVRIIRGSQNNAESKQKLIERYNLSEIQVKHVLDMKLAKLNTLEIEDVKKENNDLIIKLEELKTFLASEELKEQDLIEKIENMKKLYGDARRTKLDNIEPKITRAAAKPEVPATPVRVAYAPNTNSMKIVKQTLQGADLIDTKLNSTLVLFTNIGMAHKLRVDKITTLMQNVNNLVELAQGEKIIHIMPIENTEDVFLTTAHGMVKRTKGSDFNTLRSVQSIKLKDGDSLLSVESQKGTSFITQVSSSGKELTFSLDDVSTTGRVGIGVKGIKLKDGETVSSAVFSNELGTRTLGKRNQVGKTV